MIHAFQGEVPLRELSHCSKFPYPSLPSIWTILFIPHDHFIEIALIHPDEQMSRV